MGRALDQGRDLRRPACLGALSPQRCFGPWNDLVQYALTLACVIAIAAGQVMFKLSARSVAGSGALHDLLFSPILIAALAVYGVATVAWISQLRFVELSRAYPLMALSFVIVP